MSSFIPPAATTLISDNTADAGSKKETGSAERNDRQTDSFASGNAVTAVYLSDGESRCTLYDTQPSTVMGPLSVTLMLPSDKYKAYGLIAFVISVKNISSAAIEDVTVSFDLGAHISGGQTVVPMDYTPSAMLFLNGEYSRRLDNTDETEASSRFAIGSLAAKDIAQIYFTAELNGKAPLSSGSSIVCTAEACADSACESVQRTIFADAYAALSIVKRLSEDIIVKGDKLLCTFELRNSGNTEATDVVLSSQFPFASIDSVTVDGTPVSSDDYTYDSSGLFRLPGGESMFRLSVAAAELSSAPETECSGEKPGITVVVVEATA